MQINLLDKNDNFNIILAGILATIVGLGVARFAFTSLLSAMLKDHLDISFAGILASLNYMGYLAGAIFAIFINSLSKKVIYFRVGIVLCIATTCILAISSSDIIWLVSRFIAGFSTAMAFVVGAALVMTKITITNKTKAMGIYFSGIGFAIFVCEIIVRVSFLYGLSWQNTWKVLVVFASFVSLYSIYILSFDKLSKDTKFKHSFDKSVFSWLSVFLIMAYFTAGIGFVVNATFLPDIINSVKGLSGYGSLIWLFVGVSGIVSCVIWMSLAHKYGSLNIIMIVMTLQALGIILPAISSNIYLNIFSGILYGGTMVALVGLFLNIGGKLSWKNPVSLMGALTTSYGIAQVVGPLYTIKLIKYFHNYNAALYLTSFIVFGGVVLVLLGKKFASESLVKEL